ncbi:MAG: acetyl-CoA hydrolase/transferase C-terminal domain-containing protein [Dehalococcoidia bacterium]|nr:acetyl-CoA hydrolase/transferase C-terminal domain-containing protein [Dehalococcoidia bacterium]
MTATDNAPTAFGDWREAYKERLRTSDEAMQLVQDGDLVAITILAPAPLADALRNRGNDLGSVDIRFLAPREVELFDEGAPKGEKEIELFIGDTIRPMHDARVATYLPNTFMLGMKAHDAGREEARMPDVFLTPISEPNEAGFVHYGPHMWMRKAYTRRARHTIGMVDPNLTPVHGDVWAHVSEFSAIVPDAVPPVNREAVRERINTESPEGERARRLELLDIASDDQLAITEARFHMVPIELIERALGLTPIDPAAQGIADNLRQLIRDGDTIQVGVGEPSQLMFKAGAFDDSRNLGLHTELGSPGLAKLWARGILDGSRKSIHRGKNVAVAWSGCDGEDLNIIRGNPAFELYDPDYLLNPRLMSQNHNMTSINSAVAVDLLGQVASEDRFGGHMINGTGGQPDTHLSAMLSPGGRAITVLRSTALQGSLSKIVAQHEKGTLVTIPRYLADTIVTEHGVARLMDKNHRQRARELISIAHPDFRADLEREAQELWG